MKVLNDEQIEKLALKYEAFGMGQVDAYGLTTHGFDYEGLRAFARAVVRESQLRTQLPDEVFNIARSALHFIDTVDIYEDAADHIRKLATLILNLNQPPFPPMRTALQEYRKYTEGCGVIPPMDALHFFCGLAMEGQDWLDAEPFFDAVKALTYEEDES